MNRQEHRVELEASSRAGSGLVGLPEAGVGVGWVLPFFSSSRPGALSRTKSGGEWP